MPSGAHIGSVLAVATPVQSGKHRHGVGMPTGRHGETEGTGSPEAGVIGTRTCKAAPRHREDARA